MFAGAALLVLGYSGLAWGAAGASLAWVVAAGLGVAYFPVCLYLINARSRSHAVTIAASAFVQSFGYAVGAVGPIVFGLLHSATGGWTPSLVMLIVSPVVVVVAGLVLRCPRMIDDDLDRGSRSRP